MKYVMGKASIFNGAGRLHVYDFSALLSGSDGVRASEGFLCAVAATEPTGCALPEGPSRARWQARERSERVRRGRQRGSGGDALPAPVPVAEGPGR